MTRQKGSGFQFEKNKTLKILEKIMKSQGKIRQFCQFRKVRTMLMAVPGFFQTRVGGGRVWVRVSEAPTGKGGNAKFY